MNLPHSLPLTTSATPVTSTSAKEALLTLIQQALAALGLQAPKLALERPKQAEHGDYACTIALQLAKTQGKNPRALAQELVNCLPTNHLIAKADIAGPGFINFTLSPLALFAVLDAIEAQGLGFGHNQDGAQKPFMVEFVSANPTGPLHVGHGRAATIGDVLASILAANGWAAYREFYYNDAGEQINMLTQSVQARARQVGTPDYPFPEKGYQGSYIGELAQSFLSQGGDADDAEAIRKFAVAALRQVQDDDLQAYRVKFDHYFLESSLYTEGKVEATVQRLKANGKTYELDGALWLKTSDYGDDKDRVMLRSDGKGYTYFVPDIAYHQSKFERGFHRVITELGADHHGSLARVRAGLQALEIGVPEGFPDYVLHQMVMVVRDGQEVKFSKRAGDYYTLRDLIDEVGVDVVRFFFLMRKHDSQLTFDLDLAKKQSEENPVYYVQYAHARHCQVLAKVGTQSGVFRAELLHSKHEIALTRLLADYPDAVRAACSELSPHLLVNYVRELAAQFHSYYNAEQFLVANADLQTSRLRLVACCGQVIRGALALLGVSAPERM